MNEKEQRLAQDELRTTRDVWMNLSLQRMFEFENRENRIMERNHSSIVAFSSLAIAMVAIVFPIYASSALASCLSIASVVLLLISAIYGIGLIIFSNAKEGMHSKLQNDAEQKFLSRQLEEVINIYWEAIDGNLKRERIANYLNIKEENKEKYAQDIKSIIKHSSLFDKLYYLFLALFCLGLLLFIISTFSIFI